MGKAKRKTKSRRKSKSKPKSKSKRKAKLPGKATAKRRPKAKAKKKSISKSKRKTKAKAKATTDQNTSMTLSRVPAGHTSTESGLVVPLHAVEPVQPSKLKKGYGQLKTAVRQMLQDLAEGMGDGFVVREIELTASFNADGKFLGFGVGGATSITIRVGPSK